MIPKWVPCIVLPAFAAAAGAQDSAANAQDGSATSPQRDAASTPGASDRGAAAGSQVGAANAQGDGGGTPGRELTREELAATLPGVQAEEIHDSIIPGLYELVLDAEIVYVSRDGSYLIQGDVFDLRDRQNLTERRRARARVEILATADPATMIVFNPPPEDIRHTVTVFTDIDCSFCRQLHRQMEEFNALGVAVRYLAYPRTGPATDSWFKADKIWCEDDRQTAFTAAILKDRLPEQSCEATPVAEHYQLGRQVGVRGTPTIITSGGVHVGGYLAPEELVARLEALTGAAPTEAAAPDPAEADR